MKKYLYPVIAILMLALVSADHYTINMYLSEFEVARKYNLAEMDQVFHMQDIIFSNQSAQETLLMVARRGEQLESRLSDCIADNKFLRETNERQENVLMTTADTVKELTDDNAQLQRTLDTNRLVFERLRNELAKSRAEIQRLKEEIKNASTTD